MVANQGERELVDRRLRDFCEQHTLLLHSKAGFTAACDEMMAGVLGSAWVLLALVFVVASLGTTNCLMMNVLEQTRELGILRAIAMKRRQICKMVVAQALALGVISAVPGALLGVLLGLAVSHATYTVSGMEISYRLEWSLLVGCVALSLVLAVLASWIPARRASRLTVITALQYE